MRIGIEATRIPSTPSQGSRNPVSGVTGLLTDVCTGVGTGRVNRERDSGAVRSGEERLNESLFVPFHRCNLLVIFVREYILPLLKEIGMLILSVEEKIKVSTNRI